MFIYDSQMMILMELCQNGALREFLQHSKLVHDKYHNQMGSTMLGRSVNDSIGDEFAVSSAVPYLPWNLLTRIACDISEGLCFLHSKKLVHR